MRGMRGNGHSKYNQRPQDMRGVSVCPYHAKESGDVGWLSYVMALATSTVRVVQKAGGTTPGRSDVPTALSLSCLLYTSPSPRDRQKSRMPSSA